MTSRTVTIAALALLMVATSAQAHTGTGTVGGFLSGFEHPILGWDHVIAMVAVGLWGTFLGWPAIWMLPVIFPIVMAFGGALGIIGVPLPSVETGIALSGILLGSMVAFAVRAPLWIAATFVGIFAVFHGHAHGSELPQAADPVAYGVGFVIATGLLHLSGIGLGFLTRLPFGGFAVRGLGLGIAATGAAFLIGAA